MSSIYKNYKLSSGEEVLGKLIKNDLDTITLHRPMLVKVITMENGFGEMRDMMMLRPWNNISNELSCQIKREHIVLESIPSTDVVEMYQHQMEKEDVITDLYNDLKDDPERMEQYVRDMIDNTIDGVDINEESTKNDTDDTDDIDEDVQMNFVIPSAMFLAFLMNGIVSLDPESKEKNNNEEISGLDFNIQEFLKKFPKREKEDKRRYRLDFDEYFKDWNPEP